MVGEVLVQPKLEEDVLYPDIGIEGQFFSLVAEGLGVDYSYW